MKPWGATQRRPFGARLAAAAGGRSRAVALLATLAANGCTPGEESQQSVTVVAPGSGEAEEVGRLLHGYLKGLQRQE